MELSDYLRILRKNWIVLVCATVVGVLAGGLFSVMSTKTYIATTQLFVSVQSADSNSTVDAVQGSNAAQQKVKSYVDVATSARVLSPVIDKLNLGMTLPELAQAVSASSPANSVLIDLAVTSPDPQLAADIANGVGSSLTRAIVEDLESPISGGASLVKLEAIEPATPPTDASSPRIAVNVVLGMLAGLVLGLVVSAIRTALDTRIHNLHDVETVSGRAVLGNTSFDPNIARQPLIVHGDPRSPRAESYRALRTNLKFIGVDSKRRVFMTTSSMPGEGKTTTTANLAIALAESGARVVLVDADLRRPRTADIMDVEGTIGLTDVLIGGVELDDALQPWGRRSLHVLAAGSIPPNPSELLGSSAMQAVIEHLAESYDYVLIDAPPLLPVTDAAVLSSLTNGVIVVAAARKTTRSQLRSALENLERVDAHVLGLVVTMLPAKGAGAYGYGNYSAYYGVTPDSPPPTKRAGKRAARIEADRS